MVMVAVIFRAMIMVRIKVGFGVRVKVRVIGIVVNLEENISDRWSYAPCSSRRLPTIPGALKS